MSCNKITVFIVAASVIFMILSNQTTEARPTWQNITCVGVVKNLCNYWGNFCHADILSGRRRRSLSSAPETVSRALPRRKRFYRVRLLPRNRCPFCKQVCW